MNLSSPHRQSLSDRQRRTAFGIAVVVLGALLLIQALAAGRHSAHHAAVKQSIPAPAMAAVRAPRIVGSFPPTTAAAGSAPRSATTTTSRAAIATTKVDTATTGAAAPRLPGITSQHRDAIPTRTVLAHARRFLSAYVVYEVRPLDAVMRAVLRRSSTAALGAQLLAHPVRLPAHDRPAVGTVQSLELGGDPDSITVTADATIARAGWVSGLILDFDRSGGRWLVSRVS